MRNGYKFVEHRDRIAIIYDNFIHDLQPMAISKARNIHYNTVRHILHRFYEDGHLNIKKPVNENVKKNSIEGSVPNDKESDTQPDSNSDHDVPVIK